MNNKQLNKCLVIHPGQHRCIVIDRGSEKQSIFCLPTLSEIAKEILQKNHLKNLDEEVILLLTPQEEVSPWDLFEPFPPASYYDYSYLDFKSKGIQFYLLQEEDKIIVEKHLVMLSTL